MTADEIVAAALTLDPATRAEVAEKLIQSLDQEAPSLSEAEWGEAWGAEAERRLSELRTGKVKGIPGDQVFSRVRAIVNS